MTTYYIGSSSDFDWTPTNAKTLQGAKRIASQTYQQSVGGKIEVAIREGDYQYVVAVKYGYDKWRDA